MKKLRKRIVAVAFCCLAANFSTAFAQTADVDVNKIITDKAKADGVEFKDGRFRDKDDTPVPVIAEGKYVDWGTWQGFRRYHDACHVCHGPNADGSTFAPALADSLKTIDYAKFLAVVAGGQRSNSGGTEFVMPAFGEDKNVMCYIDDIYTYIKARSLGILPPGRPSGGRQDISDEARTYAKECFGE